MSKLKHILGGVAILAAFATAPVLAQTPDGMTPAEEVVCSEYSGKLFGLCNAYCEAMDCDSDNPQASDQACDRVLDRIVIALPDGAGFPDCFDVDGDGVNNGTDNCPNDYNPGQENIDLDLLGDACDSQIVCSDGTIPSLPGDCPDIAGETELCPDGNFPNPDGTCGDLEPGICSDGSPPDPITGECPPIFDPVCPIGQVFDPDAGMCVIAG